MVNEFRDLKLLCIAPELIPPYGNPVNQGCALPGAVAGSTTVSGDAYLQAQLNYSYSHLWRNVGIIIAFWAFFVIMTLFGMEMTLRPPKVGGNVNVYKKGTVNKRFPNDEEAQNISSGIQSEKHQHYDPDLYGIAKSSAVFTWSGVRYVIDTKDGKKALLDNVCGYVKPGRMTALVGGT